MFQRNDKFFHMSVTVVNITAIVFAALCLAFGIVAMVVGGITLGMYPLGSVGAILLSILSTAIGLLGCFLYWLFARLILSHICDVKFIRNKTYDESNTDLIDYYDPPRQPVAEQTDSVAQLREWKRLCDDGIIAKEDFERKKEEILQSANDRKNA